MPLDLSNLFNIYAKKFVKEFKGFVRQKTGIDGNTFSPLKNVSKTVQKTGKKAGQSRKRNPNSRLNDSGNFRENFVIGESTDYGMTISGNKSTHPKGISYSNIIAYNNKNSPAVNKNITTPPLIFPTTVQEVKSMGLYQEFEEKLKEAIRIQMGDAAKLNINETIVVGGK
jgi:hypothetical protein